MSRLAGPSSSIPTIIPPPSMMESKRDRKRRETINKIEVLHDDSWRNREERFQQLWKDYHAENKAVNTQPPTSANYLLRLYPKTLERDALLAENEIMWDFKLNQARRDYKDERAAIEAQYNEAKEQVVQRLLGSIEERRRKLREEKEGGEVISEGLLEAAMKPKTKRRKLFSNRTPSSSSRTGTPLAGPSRGLNSITPDEFTNGNGHGSSNGNGNGNGASGKSNDLLLHNLLAPSLAHIGVDDILSANSTSLSITPAPNGQVFQPPAGKRGPRGKQPEANGNGDKDTVSAAPGTLTALAIASGQQAPVQPKTSRGAGAQGQWVLGKSLADLSKMTTASQLEIESDWARIQGTTGRGRRNRGE